MTAPGGSIGSVHGQIRITYDNRGIAQARNDLGQFVSMAGLFGDQADRSTRKASNGFKLAGVHILGMAKYMLIAGAAATALHGSMAAVVAITQAIIPLVNAGLATLPGIILSAAAAAVVLKLALAGVGDALKAALSGDAEKMEEAIKKLAPEAQTAVRAFAELAKQGKEVQQAIQNAFFAGTGAQIEALIAPLLSLRTEAVGVATGFNGIVREILGFAGSTAAIEPLRAVLNGVKGILDGMKEGIRPLLEGFFALGGQLGQFGPAIGLAIGGGMKAFGEFLKGLDLKELFAKAKPIIDAIVTLFVNLGSIAASIFTGLGLAGGNAFGVLGTVTTALADFLKTAAAQDALKALGQVISDLSGNFLAVLSAILRAVAPAITALAPLVSKLADLFGGILTQAITALAPILLTLVQTLVDSLLPVLPQIMTAFEALLPVVAQLVTLFANHLATILPMIIPLLVQLALVVAQTLVQALIALMPALQQLLPAFAQFGREILPALLPLILQLGQLFLALMPAIMTIANLLAGILIPLMPVLAGWVKFVAGTLTFLIGVIASVIGWWTNLISKLITLEGVKSVVQAVINFIAGVFKWLYNLLIGNSIIPDIINGIFSWFRKLASIPGEVTAFFIRLKDGIVGKMNEAIAFIRSIPGTIMGVLGNLGGMLYDAGRSIIQGLINGIQSMIGNVKNAVQGVLQKARDLLPFSPAKEGPFSGRGWTLYSGKSMMEGLAAGILAGRKAVTDAMGGAVGGLASTMTVRASTAPVGAQTAVPVTTAGPSMTVHQTVNALPGMDAEQVGNYTLQRLAFGVRTGTSSVMVPAPAGG